MDGGGSVADFEASPDFDASFRSFRLIVSLVNLEPLNP